MPRPVKRRRICQLPKTESFAPCSGSCTGQVELTLDEYEAIRLIDFLGLSQEECAGQMNVARTTVQAIYDTARRKLADMLVNGKQLHIRGGSYDICPYADSCRGKNCKRRRCEESGCGAGRQGCCSCRGEA